MGTQLPNGKEHSSPLPLVGPCLLWPNGCLSQLLLSSCLTFLFLLSFRLAYYMFAYVLTRLVNGNYFLRLVDFICLRVGFRFRKSSIFLVQCSEVFFHAWCSEFEEESVMNSHCRISESCWIPVAIAISCLAPFVMTWFILPTTLVTQIEQSVECLYVCLSRRYIELSDVLPR